MDTALYVYVDGWNFYHGINTPELHPLGFTDLRKLCQHILGTRVQVDRVHYFTATDYDKSAIERQRFLAGRSRELCRVLVEPPGFFRHIPERGKHEEKTTDVRIALKIAEDARVGSTRISCFYRLTRTSCNRHWSRPALLESASRLFSRPA